MKTSRMLTPFRLLPFSKSQVQFSPVFRFFCVPSHGWDLRPMAEELANGLVTKVPEWTLVNEGGTLKLSCSWKVKTFTKGLVFFQAIADVAEAEGGLTENDFILAAKIDNLDLAHLLRIKPSK